MHPGSSPNTSGCATPKARIQTPSLADLLASIRTMVAIPFRNAKNIPQIGTNHEGIVSTWCSFPLSKFCFGYWGKQLTSLFAAADKTIFSQHGGRQGRVNVAIHERKAPQLPSEMATATCHRMEDLHLPSLAPCVSVCQLQQLSVLAS